jgi:hypothetical protein
MSDQQDPQYDPPQVEQIPAESGPAVTAADQSGPADNPPGPEWRPEEKE